ncbi:hypothetical protein HELRODRAFT_161326 [Helobdella robusta]|uniref:Solute carrier organic anion transporter family member n=1 Tax=Helobdella robusta TaxID=6412 RepID=T1ERC5_HELRO|nr:hypothetical protein HELRODRAFT_161326 [Helobdella robusta]ESO02095.1 hypothetical protein HELRODRAFT_161326 [Helobdella robusta]
MPNNPGKKSLISYINKVRTNIWAFFILILLFAFTHGVQGSMITGVLTTVEKRFNLPSSLSGILIAVATLGYISGVLINSIFLVNKSHVRVFAVFMTMTALAALIYVVPHFLFYNDMEPQKVGPTANKQKFPNYTNKTNVGRTNKVALSMFCVAEIIQGVSGSSVWTIGLTFIDKNTSIALGSKLFGAIFLLRCFSPVLSFALGSSFLTFPVDLQSTSWSPEHPRWIGAWWLGYVVCFIANTLIAIPTYFLPDTFINAITSEERSKSQKSSLISKISETFNDYIDKPVKEKMSSVKRIVCNPMYTIFSLGVCFDCYILAYFTFLPKYIEVNFRLSATTAPTFGVFAILHKLSTICLCTRCLCKPSGATIVSEFVERGMIPVLCAGLSSYLGGVCSGKFEQSHDKGVSRNMTFVCAIAIVNLFVLASLMNLRCSDEFYSATWSIEKQDENDLQTEMQRDDCNCRPNSFDPVCGPNKSLHIDKCYVECVDWHKDSNKSRPCFLEDDLRTEGYCAFSCTTILGFLVFGIVIMSFLNSIYTVAITNVVLKSVSKKDKPLALVVPTPVLYGKLIDWTCILWIKSCDGTYGSCLVYDNNKFRYVLHGNTLVWKILAVCSYIVAFTLAKKRLKKLESTPEEKEEKIVQELFRKVTAFPECVYGFCGRVVSVSIYYSHDPSSNPAASAGSSE